MPLSVRAWNNPADEHLRRHQPAYELGRPQGLLLAQRYTRTRGIVRPAGNPALIGRPDPLVHDSVA
ncbi:hypothetical protein [Actinoplanes subglobosus]|uniref:Uncharacterized protein n=1 Tax=Actinoplanes subglobosus TaxID=1547892 RepID=A0ABV8IQH7_9ACTN